MIKLLQTNKQTKKTCRGWKELNHHYSKLVNVLSKCSIKKKINKRLDKWI